MQIKARSTLGAGHVSLGTAAGPRDDGKWKCGRTENSLSRLGERGRPGGGRGQQRSDRDQTLLPAAHNITLLREGHSR